MDKSSQKTLSMLSSIFAFIVTGSAAFLAKADESIMIPVKPGAPYQFEVNQIPTIPNSTYAYHGVSSINNNGIAVGEYQLKLYLGYEFILSGSGINKFQPGTDENLFFIKSSACEITDDGTIFGDYEGVHNGRESTYLYLYKNDYTSTIEAPFPGWRISRACSGKMNSRGQILYGGYGPIDYDSGRNRQAYFLSINGTSEVLPEIIAGDDYYPLHYAYDNLNNKGEIIGHALRPSGYYDTFIYSVEGIKFIDIVPNADETPLAINDRGDILVTATDTAGSTRSFLYHNGKATLLAFPGAKSTAALYLNANSTVLGSYQSPMFDYQDQDFLYQNGVYRALPKVIPKPSPDYWRWTALNDRGQLAGRFGSGWFYSDTPPYVFIASPTLIDDFTRTNGALGLAWSGSVGPNAYQIVRQSVDVRGNGPIYWKKDVFGADQDAYVTLTKVDPWGHEQDLLLKVQGGDKPDYRKGAIEVLYNTVNHVVRVETFRPDTQSWTLYPNTTLLLEDGDQLAARVLATGSVEIYKNQELVGTTTLNAKDQAFFNGRGGAIGVWFDGATNAVFDDFGGGNMTP